MNKYLFLLCIVGYQTIQSCAQGAESYDMHQQKSVAAIYGKWYSRPLLSILTQYKWPSIIAGMFADSQLSSYFIPGFIKKYALNDSHFLQPVEEFKTFNDFFRRKLKPEARPIFPGDNAIISPADGAVLIIPVLHQDLSFPIKGITLSLEKLLQNNNLAEEFKDGTAVIIRLAPWDYHRLHFPVSGIPSKHTIIHGDYQSVHPYVYRCGIQPLEINERHVILYETDQVGKMAIIPVGALFVGSITHTYTPNHRHNKGDEIGYFSFGGSTVVLLFQKNTIIIPDHVMQNSAQGNETPIKMGALLAESTITTGSHN